MNRMPTLFISHGSPMLALTDSPAHRFLLSLGTSLARPAAIVVASAHWETMGNPAVSFAVRPQTIHDFGGFPAALFAIDYPAPGAPDVAGRVSALLEAAGATVTRSPDRGLDHGAWVPLRLMYPQADIPVLQVSLVHGATPAAHVKLGAALAALRNEGILVIGSGSLTHNLSEIQREGVTAAVPDWVQAFGNWMHARLQADDREALLDYRRQAPSAQRNHPSEEHLLPLYVAMGAAGDGAHPQRLHTSHEYGVLAMDVYAFA